MGLNYTFELFFPRERRWDALQAIARRVPSERAEQTLVIENGEQRTLPFKNSTRELLSNGLMAPGYLSPVPLGMVGNNCDEVPDFYTSLLFERDEPIAKYVRTHQQIELEPGNSTPIGYIHLSIINDLAVYEREEEDLGLVLIECTAVATSMSLLFDASASIKRTFVDIAREAAGVCVMLSRDCQGGGSTVLWLDGRSCNVLIPDDWVPLAQVRRLVAEAEGTSSTCEAKRKRRRRILLRRLHFDCCAET